jgi:fluoroacetyl-CoA thioesterase
MKTRKAASAKRGKSRTSKPQGAHVPEESRQRPPVGLEASIDRVVLPEHTIQAVNPKLPAVFSTPSMIGLMEHASVAAILEHLPPGAISVGTRIEVDHLKAVAPGATVRAWAKLIEYRGRFLVFDVEARSGEHLIGRGRVFRAIVEPQTHGEKAKSRLT